MTQKATLRATMRNRRQQLSAQDRELAAQAIATTIINLELFKQASKLAFYTANDGEMDPAIIMHKAQQLNKSCYLPVIGEDTTMSYVLYSDSGTLVPNRYGILEPIKSKDNCICTSELELVFVPLVAFDASGNRLGMGAGYYDKCFAFVNETNCNLKLIGLAYQFQQCDRLQIDDWDVSLSGIVTEAGFLDFS